MISERVNAAELIEWVDLVAAFYARHGRDPTNVETMAMVVKARALATVQRVLA